MQCGYRHHAGPFSGVEEYGLLRMFPRGFSNEGPDR